MPRLRNPLSSRPWGLQLLDVIFKNKTTGKFWLFCTKRVQWHCEIVEL